MKKLFRGRVRLILLLAVLLAAATALTAALSGTAWGSRTVQAVLTPFRSGFSALTRQAERYYNYLFNYESLSAENDYLRRQISSMENEVRTADSLQRENERLKELLGLQEEHEDYRFNEAYIVSWDSSSWKSTFTIGKGTRSGLETGMVVVTEYGQVVGLITDIGPNWATVTTVLDTSLEISASVASAGYTGVVQGAYLCQSCGKFFSRLTKSTPHIAVKGALGGFLTPAERCSGRYTRQHHRGCRQGFHRRYPRSAAAS